MKVPLTHDGSWSVTLAELEILYNTQGFRGDVPGVENLFNRRIAMASVIKYCRGIGVDIGCQFNRITPSTIGIEYNDPLFLKNLWGAHIIRDGTDLGIFSDNALDYVYAGHMLEDVWDPVGCLREWGRVVKKDGYIAMLLPHADFYPRVRTLDCNPHHKFDYWPKHLKEMIDACLGNMFEVIQLETFNNQFEFDIVLKRR